ncbi:30S ribosomal protein S8 [candidate division Kazan bacterium RBG_13_50_9]|uniref:Small ribosomal subunit protein uS8 n=1 Tax=candidate division Kazan bacterium RBG_13_50_9 TaxID=1798535 RepID=A0A1F4NSL2_UNCK3|nr:MAG: 30S ribosomal protein S8 [candidate division Kazan bacterium RBG_13_50_9]
MNTDPIADMLARIRNATARGFAMVRVPASRRKEAVADVLVKRGYLEGYELVESEESKSYPQLVLTLRYYAGRPVIQGLKRISKPGRRAYCSSSAISKMMTSRQEELVVSTSRGLMTGQEAVKAKLGGEVLFKIW